MPWIQYANLPLFSLLFARQVGLFLFSPLFVGRGVPISLRLALVFLSTLILLPHLLTDLPETVSWIFILKEMLVGFFLGTLFAFLLEAAFLAGRWFAALSGFSITEMLAPFQQGMNPLFVTFFSLIVVLFILILDLHHLFAYLLYDSYHLIPLEQSLGPKALSSLTESAHLIFTQGLSYTLIPLCFLLMLLLFLALLSKIFPEIPIFWLGLSIQLFFGFAVLSLLICFMAPLVQKSFIEILSLVSQIFA